MSLRKFTNHLSYKVGVGFSLVALVLIGTILYTLIQLHLIIKRADSLSNQMIYVITNSIGLRNSLNNMMMAERDWLITGDVAYQLQRRQVWNNDILPTLNNLSLIDPNITSHIKLKDLTQIESQMQQLNLLLRNTELMGTPSKAQPYFYQTTNPLFLNLRLQLTSFIETQRSTARLALSDLNEQIERIFVINLSLLIIGSILCTLMGIILTRTLARPITQLVHVTREMARGNLEQYVNIGGAEEFTELSQSFNNVIHTLQDVSTVTGSMAEGDYSHRVEIKSDKDKLGIAVNAMLDDFNQIVGQANAISEGDFSADIKPRSPIDTLGKALSHMTKTLRENQLAMTQQNWLKDGVAQFASVISESHDLDHLCESSIQAIAHYCEAGTAAMYLYEPEEKRLHLRGTFAFVEKHALSNNFALGEGIVGQVALERTPIMLTHSQEQDYVISSGIDNTNAEAIYAFPLIYERNLIGVCVLAWVHQPHPLTFRYLEALIPLVSGHIQAARQQAITEKLLEEQKLLADQLRTQQEELKVTNEELEEQTQILKTSEEELRLKDEEQRQINKQLAERTQELEQQKAQVERTNYTLQLTSKELKIKAEALAKASQYKSEFLANMSHELRTPLNSLLILAKLFAENRDKNLSDEQIESAKIMYHSGQDLLTIINDILDLAKVEAGKVEIIKRDFEISGLVKEIHDYFITISNNKGIQFKTEIAADVPKSLYSDQQRIAQILRNLCANSVKFTEHGEVKLRVFVAKRQSDLAESKQHQPWVAFEVRDTGIGIPQDKQHIVFEAFQQADGTTSRKYGGTGLGLSISRQFSRLLGGKMSLQSEVNKGSAFTLFIPMVNQEEKIAVNETMPESSPPAIHENHPVKKHSIKKLLIVEDDPVFADLLMKISRQRGFQCKHVIQAEEALAIAERDQPDAILLDIGLPGMDGLVFLDQLKTNVKTKHIPVQVISASEISGDAIKRGAIGYLTKPITTEQLDRAIDSITQYEQRHIKHLLLVEDDTTLLNSIANMFSSKADLQIEKAKTGQEAIAILKNHHIDCIILDLGLPDISGQDLVHQLYQLAKDPQPAIIIFTGKELNDKETEALNSMVDSIVIKGSTASLDRLVEETDWFLRYTSKDVNQNVANDNKTKIEPTAVIDSVPIFDCQTIMLVDDDERSSFALAQALKQLGLTITTMQNAKSAIETLKNHHFDLILMDIMMPDMDGYSAIETIKAEKTLTHIPIIALTAKALPEDEKKCLDHGADDYIAKPIDLNLLGEKLRKWLTQK